MPAAEDVLVTLLDLLRRRPAPLNPADPQHHVFLARAPGRLDVMGGIADYTGALVCEMPLALSAAVAMQRRPDRKVIIETRNDDATDAAARRVEFDLDEFWGTAGLLPLATIRGLFAGPRHWASYVAGAYYVLLRQHKLARRAGGANIVCYSQVPLGAGVSSSAALESATLSALTAAYGLLLEPLELAVLAQRVENQVAAAPCGVMDQVTSVLGRTDRLLLLECQPYTIQGYLEIPAGVLLAGVNSNVRHAVGGSAYRATRVAAFMGQAIIAAAYHALGVPGDPLRGYLANLPREKYQRFLRPVLPRRLTGGDFIARYGASADRVTTVDPAYTYHVRAATDHHVYENEHVHKFAATLQAAHAAAGPAREQALRRAGRLMLASHASYGHRARLGCPETDLLVRLLMARAAQGIYGAKITGGGSGGTVAVLCADTPAARAALAAVAQAYQQQTGIVAQILTGSGPGAADTPPRKLPSGDLLAAGAA